MIIEKKPLSDDLTFDDAPPSYDEVRSSSRTERKGDSSKHAPRQSFSSTPGAESSSAAASSSQLSPPRPKAVASPKLRTALSSAGRPSLKSQADVHTTVLGLVRNLVQKGSAAASSAESAQGILNSCSTACVAHGLSVSRVLQERSVEGHTPIYWAIVNRRRSAAANAHGRNANVGSVEGEKDDEDILFALLTYAAPLSPASVADMRLACLVTADNALFQRLRVSPAVNPLSGTDRMLLSGLRDSTEAGSELEGVSNRWKGPGINSFGDIADVREGEADVDVDAGAFTLHIELPMFQRRMRVSNEIALEFVARGRIWLLCFFVVPPSSPPSTSESSSPSSSSLGKFGNPSSLQASTAHKTIPESALAAVRARKFMPGAWVVCLALLPYSPSCAADAQLVVAEPEIESQPPAAPHPMDGTTENEKNGPPLPPRPSSSSFSMSNAFRMPSFPLLDYVRPPATRHAASSSAASPRAFAAQRTALRGRSKSESRLRPPITLRLVSPGEGTGALVAPPPPPDDDPYEFGEAVSKRAKKKEERAKAKAKRRAEHAAEARAQRELKGKETKRERGERMRSAQTVLIVSLEEEAGGTFWRQGQGQGRGGSLMYDGCSYIAPDGTLRAALEARLRNATGASKKPNSDCIIC